MPVSTTTTRTTRTLLLSVLGAFVVAIFGGSGLTGLAASAASISNTPVWIGAGYSGSYTNGTRPGQHGGNQVSFDYFAPAGTLVEIYAAPKNNAYNNQITAHIIASGAGSNDAQNCGYYAVVEIRHSGNPVGRVTFSHLAAPAALGTISRWGGDVGRIAALPVAANGSFPNPSCYQVRYASGRHSHIEFRSYGSQPACGHDWGAVSIPVTRYQGYIGNYGKSPLSGNRCPSGI